MASQFDVPRRLASSAYCGRTDRSILRPFFFHVSNRFDLRPCASIHKLDHCAGAFWMLINIPYPAENTVPRRLYPIMLFTKRQCNLNPLR